MLFIVSSYDRLKVVGYESNAAAEWLLLSFRLGRFLRMDQLGHYTQHTWLHQKKGKWLQVSRAITEELPADHSHICKHFRKPVFKVFPKDIWQQCFVYVGWHKKHTPHLRAGIYPLLELQTTLSQHVHCYENLQSNGQIKVGPKVGNIVVQKGSSHFLLSIHNVNALICSRSPPQLPKFSCLLIAISYKP